MTSQCAEMAERKNEMPARVFSVAFVRAYLVTMRPYLLFVSGITGLVGLSLAPQRSIGSTLLLAMVFFLSYGFGQALTDCFQMDTDSISAPYRPLIQGKIRRADVITVSLMGLMLSGLVVALHNSVNILLAALSIVGLATYTHFKRRWWAGPFYNAWIIAVLALIGYASGLSAANTAGPRSLALAGTLFAVFFGYANFVLTGYYKDISADRVTGYRTLPVVFGLRVSNVVSDLFALLSLGGCALATYVTVTGTPPTDGQTVSLVFLAAGTTAVVVAQVRLHKVRDEGAAHRAIVPVVHAYVLLLSGISALQKPAWAPALVLFYLGFLVTMQRRPMRQQI